MESHVPALNAFAGQGLERGEVLRQADAGDDLGQLTARVTPRMRRARRAPGWTTSVPPTVPRAIGISRRPTSASLSTRHVASGR